MSVAFQNPSAMTAFTLSLKIACGSCSDDGTSLLGTVSLTVLSRLPLLALGERDRQRRGRVGLLLDGLVDGHALVALEDGLQPLLTGVLTGHRHLAVEPVGLKPGDDALRHRVVGGDDAVDLAAVLRVQLLERGAGLVEVPLAGLVADHLVVCRCRPSA